MQTRGPAVDAQAVGKLLGMPAEPGDLGDERGEPVGLVAAEVGDARELGFAVGKRA